MLFLVVHLWKATYCLGSNLVVWDSHWMALANNSTRCNTILGEKATFGDKRWLVGTLFPSFVDLLQFVFMYVCTSTLSCLHTVPQMDVIFAVSPFIPSLISSPPLIPIHLSYLSITIFSISLS